MYLFPLILSVLIYAASAQYNEKERDYYKEFLSNPSAHRIHFRFQQRRKDQPMQVEERDESVGQYLGRPRYTSTTPDPTFDTVKSFSEVQKPNPVSSFDADEWNQFYGSEYQPPSHPLEHYAARVSNKPSSETPIQWHDPTSQFQTAPQYQQNYPYYASQPQEQYQYQPEYAAQPIKAPEYQPQYYPTPETTSTTAFPETTQYVDASQHYYIRQRAQSTGRHPSRGSHKFNEIDVNVPTERIFDALPTQAPFSAAPSAPTSFRPKSPPPLPTLSPWSGDNFGK